ncbi:MAG: AAA-like domain-containing protein, partial [Cyanobacteria bacterium J06560_6]
MTAPNYDYVYQPGGSLGFRAPSYVPRQADDDLYEGIKSGRFCYVFNCRQMGKSSLRVRVSKRLEQDGYRCAALDLTALGGDEHLTPAQWYRSLITELNRSLSLLSVAEFDAWLAASDGLTAVYALSQFIEDVVLAKTAEQPVVIFIDEIDNVLSLSFDTTDLFAVIRNCYNKRADNPDYERLNFSLFGVATPAKLMRDTSRTPFNIGKAIRLMPLDLAQAKPLENGLVGWAESPEQVLRAIFEWTGGQPYLTQRLCELVQDEGMAHGAMPSSDTAAKVAELAEKNILTNWQLQDEQNHLKTIQDRLLRQSNLINRVVDLYGQVLEKGEISVTSNDEATVELRLSGIVVEEAQKLRSFNRIYRCVFGSDWVTKTLGDLRPHSTMFESWVASGSNARDHLLRGEMLKVAEAWAEGKSLSDLDNRYLRESQKAENMTFRKWAQASTLVSGIVAVGMLLAATTSYKAYIDIEEKVTVSQLQVTTNVSKNFLLENKPMEALVAAVKGGQIVKEKSLQSSQGGAIVLAALHQARYSSRNPNVQGASSFQEYNRLSVHSDGVSSMSFSPDGETLASASYDGTVKLWSIAGEQLETLSGHSDEVYRMSFSPDGETLASASGDGTVKLWSIAGEQLETLSGHSDRVHSVSFSPDGETLASASGDGTVKLWSIAGEQLETLSGHSDRVYGVSFSPDGETLASASYDGTVKLWSIAGEQLETLSGHSD